MKCVKMYFVDAFTTKSFEGNQAPVILGADDLTDDQMQMIARELNASETVFISSSTVADFRTRYFTPKTEVEFCGHGTIAAYYVLSQLNLIDKAKITHETKAGVLPIFIERDEPGEVSKVMMQQQNPQFFETNVSREMIADALNININQIIEKYPIQNISTGRTKLIIPISSLEVLEKIQPNFDKIYDICKMMNTNGFHLFTFDVRDENSITSARHFAPTAGINEDPVTGNVAGALGAYLIKYCSERISIREKNDFIMEQGDHMKKRGRIFVSIELNQGGISSVQVGGAARILFATEFKV